MKLPAFRVAAWLEKPLEAQWRAFLLYGRNAGALSLARQSLTRQYLGAEPDPLAATSWDEARLLAEPALLAEEAATMPMFGDKKLLCVRLTREAAARPILAYLDKPAPGALLIVEAGSLTPKSALRLAFERSPHAMALPFYEESGEDVRLLVQQKLSAEGWRIEPDALRFVQERLGDDRGVIWQELERLLLYKGEPPAGTEKCLTLEDLVAAGADNHIFSLQRMTDCLLTGALARADRMLLRLEQFGTAPPAMLAFLRRHMLMLQRARARWEERQDMGYALAAFQPPLHFTRRRAVEQQCRLWPQAQLARALRALGEAEAQTRAPGRSPALAHSIARQSLFGLGRLALRLAGRDAAH